MYSTAPVNWATGHSLGFLTSLEKSSQCILQPQSTGPQDTLWGFLPLSREAVSVFHSPSQLGHRTLFEGSYLSREKQSMYFTAPVNWATGHSLWVLTSLERSSQCILQPQSTGPQDTLWGFLPLWREVVRVFYSPS